PKDSLEDGWSAAQALLLAKERGCPMQQVTVSSDGGGCMPEFDKSGELTKMGFGRAETLIETIKSCISQSMPLEDVLFSLTANVAQLLRLSQKGKIQVGADADLVVLDSNYDVCNVMALGQWHMLNKDLKVKGTFE
ncbi:MAG: amidohydrolase family protein, partial [Cocleimonas sp.]